MLLRRLSLTVLGAAAMALILTLVSNPHALPPPYKKPWSRYTLTEKRDYVTANLRHARYAVAVGQGPPAHVRARARRRGPADRRTPGARAEGGTQPARHHGAAASGVPVSVVVGPARRCASPGTTRRINDGLYDGWINFLHSTWVTTAASGMRRHADDASEYEQYLVTLRMHADVTWAQSRTRRAARGWGSRVEPYLQDADVTLLQGDALEVLQKLPDESVHMCVTSPPFYGLRDYGTGRWEGGDAECDHKHATEHQKPGRDEPACGTLERGRAAQRELPFRLRQVWCPPC